RQCARLYARYEQCLRRLRLVDWEGRLQRACDLLARGCRHPFEQVRVVLVDGFVDFTPPQLKILEDLAQWVEEIRVTLPDEEGAERAELFTRSRSTRDRLRSLNPHWVPLVAGPENEASRRAQAAGVPAGLTHLARQLFRPLRAIQPSANAEGICRIEAPGLLGEARMVARRIKALLHSGVPAEDIFVTVRDL